MSTESQETPIVNDAITSDDAGFSSDAGDQVIEETNEVEVQDESNNEENVEEVKAETTEELKEEINDAIEDGASKEEVENMIREFELKVNGKTINKKIDLNDEEALKRELQLAAAGRGAMQESAELKKLFEQEMDRLSKDPWDVLKDLGLDPDQLAEDRIRSKVEELKKSPEQLEKERMQKELEAARAELNRQKEQAEEIKFQQLLAKAEAELNDEINQSLESNTTLPKSADIRRRIAGAMEWAMENGFDDVKAEDVIPTVEAELKKEFNSIMESLGDDKFEEYVGKKNLEKFRQKRLSSMKTNNINNIKSTNSKEQKKEEPKKKVRMSDYFDKLGR